jgi:hypothetical protein
MDVKNVGNFSFDGILRDSGGDIAVARLDGFPGEESYLIAELKVGSSYAPGVDPYSATIHVLEGEGVFQMDGIDHPYQGPTSFQVPQGRLHAFVSVGKRTTFVKADKPVPFNEVLAALALVPEPIAAVAVG